MRMQNADGSRSAGQALVEFALVAPIFLLLLFGIIEGGRFIFYYEMLNNATREGARYAIVHGNNSTCPSGPAPPGQVNTCDPAGENVKAAVRDAVVRLASTSDLFVADPVWSLRGAAPPKRGDQSLGHNGRGSYVTVFVDYVYRPVLPLLPPITVSAESTLVVNN